MNYLKYEEKRKEIFKNFSEKKKVLESKLYKITVILKNSNGEILDKETGLSIGKAYSNKYKNYIKIKNKDLKIENEISEIEKKLHENIRKIENEIKIDFLNDISKELDINIEILKKLIDLSLRKASLTLKFYIGNIEIEDADINYHTEELTSLEYFLNKSTVSEYLFNFIYKLAIIEVEYFKLIWNFLILLIKLILLQINFKKKKLI